VHEHHALFELPVTVRRKIYDYCLPDEPRKISLSPRFVTKAVFPDGSLASPWDVLEPVRGGLQAFSELRRELMTYFWTQFHFHVTLSPFTGPRFSPLSHVWLCDYLNVVQYLSVEADLTRFGFGTLQAATEFGHNVYKTETLMIKLVKGLVKRRGKTTMAEFNVMCRRYDGFRPYRGYGDAIFDFEPGKFHSLKSRREFTNKSYTVPYCPHESLFFCDAVCDLRGILHKSRVSGFTQEYTETLLQNIFTDGDYKPCFIPAKDCAWPPLPTQTPGYSFDSNHALMSLMSPCPIPPLRLTPTSSFTEEIEDEMLKYESSVYSEKIYAEEASVIEGLGIRKHKTTSTLADQAMSGQNDQECVGSIARSNSPLWSTPRIRDSDVNSRGLLLAAPPAIDSRCATPKSHEINQINEEYQVRLSDNDSGIRLLAATPTINSRAPTPHSPNEMNRRNEQDPAFVRTVDALRSLDCDDKPVRRLRPMSMIPSPVRKKEVEVAGRSQTSLGTQPRSEGTVRRYLSFVKKLRGREN
jgi:hypothetical protein